MKGEVPHPGSMVRESKAGLEKLIKNKEAEMRTAAKNLDFELAALLRDEIRELLKKVKKVEASSAKKPSS